MVEREELTEYQKATQRILDRYTLPDGTLRFLPANGRDGAFTKALKELEPKHARTIAEYANVRYVG